MPELNGRGILRRLGGDRGEGSLPFLGIMLVVATIMVTVLAVLPGGRLADGARIAVCRALHAGGAQKDGCEDLPGAAPTQLPSPYEPQRPCLVGSDSYFMEETLTIPLKRVDPRATSRNTIRLNEHVGADGQRYWEVVDFTWGELGVGVSGGGGPFNVGGWVGGQITDGNSYRFDNEAQARAFFDDLVAHRTGDPVKFTVRTNPVTGGLVWLGGKLPVVGDPFDEWMGGSEPDQDPSVSFTDGGGTAGFKGDISLGVRGVKIKHPFKGRGWLNGGSQTNHLTGETTTYFTRRGEGEAAVTVDLASVWAKLPKGTRERAAQGIDDALEAALDAIDMQLRLNLGPDYPPLDAGDRAQMKKAIQINPSGGFNLKVRKGTTWGLVHDEDGNFIRMTRTQNQQGVLYFRLDGKAAPGGAKIGAGGQWIIFGRRTLEEQHLDMTDKDDQQAFIDWAESPTDTSLNRYFEDGGGTRSRIVFDNNGDTEKVEAQGGKGGRRSRDGSFELGTEVELHVLRSAHYFVPGEGWVRWDRCTG